MTDGTTEAEPLSEPLTEPTQPPAALAPAPRDRRVLRAVARWTAAVAVFAAVGTATAYGITGMARTDVPGLATESDGRWDYPELTRPPLPSGSPGPFADGNTAGAHYADLRALVLPAPAGAREDKALRGADGWLATKDYLAEYEVEEDREALRQKLVDTGLRHIAARGWTTPDGTRTRIYLLQFDTAQTVDTKIASDAVAFAWPTYSLRGSHDAVYDEKFPEAASVAGIARTAYAEPKPYGAEQVRQAYLSAGDVYAVIVQSRKGGVPAVPFQQTVVLQSQLLR
ncbi:hypothetical protein SSP24_68880 [Streptomyces spinoverrucosus]|uniref:Uncharacterized protein n=1 Tax=Streptomyces spinoverrucosus TaxID=284043 RepID=A0A4Y3VRJ0_9ACTN|nr:hypothetical protein [Streptomyces spinoverrucosus]GEC09233.1 hypothetical protein SSP24_68880 [Streptomyces spinoverrucosus]GHB52720.1 hypothetical protein GCM10010397_23310 [Streptomyces spinoverrucosus]